MGSKSAIKSRVWHCSSTCSLSRTAGGLESTSARTGLRPGLRGPDRMLPFHAQRENCCRVRMDPFPTHSHHPGSLPLARGTRAKDEQTTVHLVLQI